MWFFFFFFSKFWCCIKCKHPETNLALNDVRYVESAQNVKKIGKKTASPLKSKGKMWLNFSISVFQKLTFSLGENQGMCNRIFLINFFSFQLFLHLCEIPQKKEKNKHGCAHIYHILIAFPNLWGQEIGEFFFPKKEILVEITLRKK